MKLGEKTKTGYVLVKKIESLDEFWQAIQTNKSIFARHKMYPSAFFYSWPIKLIKEWIDYGRFFIAYKIEKGDKIVCSKCPGNKRTFIFSHWDGCWMVSKTGINDFHPLNIYQINDIIIK